MSRSQIEEIKEKLDILSVAQEYLGTLKRSGANHFARCPFHNEKTPSFAVNPDLGIFKCFGCGESGDVITFIQKMEGVDFPEALEISAKRAGVKLIKRFSPEDQKLLKGRQELLQANALVCEYYHYILTKHKMGEVGRKYARDRGVTKELLERFKIGYAPRAYTNLTKYLKKKGYKTKDIIQWGFAISRNGRVFDKFRSRLLFPLINQHGDIVGFSGRITTSYTKAPKYLHSPTTMVFDKSKFLFGLAQAKIDIRKQGFCVFCEGQLDVISSHKTKIKNVIASLGTSIAQQQFTLLKRYADEVYFCFDTDLAGEKALLRATGMAHDSGVHVRAVTLTKGGDADELINTDRKAWENAVKNAQPILDHMIIRLSNRIDLSELRGKEEFVSVIMPLIATLPKNIEQMHYIQKIAIILNVEEVVLKEEFLNLKNRKRTKAVVNNKSMKKLFDTPASMKEEYLLALIFQHEDFIDVSVEHVKRAYFTTSASKNLIKKLKTHVSSKERYSIRQFIKTLESHEKSFLEILIMKKLEEYFEVESAYIQELQSLMNHLKRNYYQNKIRKIKADIQKAEIAGDEKGMEKFIDKHVVITDRLKHIS